MIKKLIIAATLFSLSSCYSYNNYNSSKYVDHSFFWGLQKEKTAIAAKKLCNNENNAQITVKNNLLTYFARFYTLGIYWPSNIKITCENKQ